MSIAGPIVTASGGYPSRSWGADGFAVFADTPEQARTLYGTDLGNAGTRPGADSRELERLADAGTGRLEVGAPAALVLLSGDPLLKPRVWRTPQAVCADGHLIVRSGGRRFGTR